MNILVLNGPNMNMLGIRQPEIYGKTTYEDLLAMIRAEAEKAVTEIYNNAYTANVDLYQFLRNLDTLVSSVNSSSVGLSSLISLNS